MIHIVTALPCEARPLIDHFRLQRLAAQRSIPCYQGDGIRLVVSGPGKLAAASATAWLQGIGSPAAAWLNIGIAGHGYLPVGTGLVAHRISDAGSRQNWYPGLVFTPPCGSASLITVEEAETAYREDALYDMEAAGFYSAASRFTSCELIHCYKVVSDNRCGDHDRITKQYTTQLMSRHLTALSRLVTQLQRLAGAIASTPVDATAFLERWHFSHYQQHQLQRLLQRWQTLMPDSLPDPQRLSDCQRGAEVIRHLEQRLSAMPVTL